MEKRKQYPFIKFSAEVIQEARKILAARIKRKKLKGITALYRVQTSKNESWEFDTEQEFFAAYKDTSISADFRYGAYNSSLVLNLTHALTTVSVSGSTTDEIDAVFAIFEGALDKSVIKFDTEKDDADSGPVSNFEVERKIPSCLVDKDLLDRLEKFMLHEIPEIADIEPQSISSEYSITVTDSSGVGTFPRVAELGAGRFTDSVSIIVMRIGKNYRDKSRISVTVTFDTDFGYSRFTIGATSKNSRAKVEAISEGLMRGIHPSNTLNYLYHLPTILTGLLLGLISGGIPVLIGFMLQGFTSTSWWVLSIWVVLLTYYIGGKWFNKHTTFDTQSQIRRNAIWRWFAFGILGLIVFSTLGQFLLRKL
jgi:hypothetical protein